jgi:hypothetical protein
VVHAVDGWRKLRALTLDVPAGEHIIQELRQQVSDREQDVEELRERLAGVEEQVRKLSGAMDLLFTPERREQIPWYEEGEGPAQLLAAPRRDARGRLTGRPPEGSYRR